LGCEWFNESVLTWQTTPSYEALGEQFGVTLQTVRRDVKLLSDAGLLARFHGGVRLPASTVENIAYRHYREVNVARAIIEHSRQVWQAADHGKFNRPAMVELARLNQLDMLFTDAAPPAPFPALLAEAGV